MTQPRVHARLLLSDLGAPQYVEEGGRVHYWVRLTVRDAPADVARVTYRLHETFSEPVRSTDDREAGFAIDLTSYGDFTVVVTLHGTEPSTIQASLAALLATEHGFTDQASVRWALTSIGAL